MKARLGILPAITSQGKSPAGTHGVQCISVVLGEEDPRFMGRLVPRGWDRVGPGVLRLWGFMGRKKGHKEGYKGEVVNWGPAVFIKLPGPGGCDLTSSLQRDLDVGPGSRQCECLDF